MTTHQNGLLTTPVGILLVVTFKSIWLSTQKLFSEVNDLYHAFTMLHKAREAKHEPVQVYT